jgi:hypothetical protein
MKQLVRTTIYGSIAAAALFTASGAFAAEPGDFQENLRGATIGIPAGALPPPGLYGGLETFIGPNGVGQGQNGAAEGANSGHGITVFGSAIVPSLLWVPGWNFAGGSIGLVVIQPFFTVAGLQTNCTTVPGVGCVGSEPIAFGAGAGAFFENVHNTVWQITDSWNWHNGWFTSLSFAFAGPDGSQYNGTLNQDYWTFSPQAAISYLDKNWKVSVNIDYDFHTASAGHTGSYAALASNAFGAGALSGLPGGIESIGNGYTGGQQLFIDWSAEYRWGKLAFGPVGYIKDQTTSDSPGAGLSCATLAATPFPAGGTFGTNGLGCGKTEDIAFGGIIGYDFGPAELEVWATDSVYTQDDFKGSSIFTRLSFKLDDPSPKPPAPAPMATKAH